jgi:3-methyladenine DNA glycosylase AlkD
LQNWRQEFEHAIEQRNWTLVVELLETEKTDHAGTAPAQVKRKAIKALEKHMKHDQKSFYKVTTFLGEHLSATAKEVAAHLTPHIYMNYPIECNHLLHKIADDENWEVREWAAGGCGEILAQQYSHFYPVLNVWKDDQSENVRRAVVLAVMYASKSLDEEHANKLLQLIEPLMEDHSVYVKKNLGAFAIGDALLKRYPDTVLPWLNRLSETKDENVRWNLAMVFTAAAARTFQKEGQAVLLKFEEDNRKSVQRAVKKAKRNIEKAEVESSK